MEVSLPHFGLMKTEDSFKTEEGALLRTRLHIRGGTRRLHQGKISAGIVTLYDALLFAMQWYIMSPERRKKAGLKETDAVNNDRAVMEELKRGGVLTGQFDYDEFDRLVDRALLQEMPDFDFQEVLKEVESVMTQLGVMPFDEKALPPEDPATF